MPPRPTLLGCLILPLLVLTAQAIAQSPMPLVAFGNSDSVVVFGYAGDPETAPTVIHGEWAGMDGGTPTFHFKVLKDPGSGLELRLDRLIIAGVEQYLDQRVHFTKQGVQTDLPPDQLAEGVDRMVGAAAARFGAPAIALSTASREQLGRVSRIDWSQASFGVEGGDDQEKYLAIYYYVRAQRQELERQLRNDLVPLATVDVLPNAEVAEKDPGTSEPVPTVCNTVFDDENFLCALDLQVDSTGAASDVKLTDSMLADIAAKAGEQQAAGIEPPKLRKRDRWLKAELDAINKRIDQSDQRKELWALRDRMDDMEGRMDDIALQVEDLETARDRTGGSENPVANLSALTGKNITIHFAKGGADLGRNETALLDEVVRAMGQERAGRVLLTGYADRSGAPAANLALSERRAKVVRRYLLDHGIGGERVLLNYFGARKSTGVDPAERRVELEWIP